jgi:cephalosporin hydroxylase
MGRPIIQFPEDMVRVQEVIYRVKPDVIIETGIAHGGSLVYYASLCRAMGHGRVIGIDVDIRPQNSRAMEMHELAPLITLVQGDSVAPSVLEKVRHLVGKDERCLVILDSAHTREHVARELEAYAGFVAPDSYIIVNDGIMHDLADVPRGDPTWTWDNPGSAAKNFADGHRDFVLEQPPRVFNESDLDQNVTHWPGGYLRRL